MCIRDRSITSNPFSSIIVLNLVVVIGSEVELLPHPVSYTHLDVYKRQVTSIARQSVILKCNMQKAVMLGNYIDFGVTGNIDDQMLDDLLKKVDSLNKMCIRDRFFCLLI